MRTSTSWRPNELNCGRRGRPAGFRHRCPDRLSPWRRGRRNANPVARTRDGLSSQGGGRVRLSAQACVCTRPGPVHVLLTVECLRLDRRSALRAGSLLRSLREGGRTLEVRDVLQAGIYLEAGATLITRNLGHYSRVPGLKVLAPAQAAEQLSERCWQASAVGLRPAGRHRSRAGGHCPRRHEARVLVRRRRYGQSMRCASCWGSSSIRLLLWVSR
jgi:hypothetical protein